VTLTGTGGESGDAKGVTARPERDPGTLAAPEPQPTTPATTPARLRLPVALAVALAGGLALAAAFPPVGIWPLAPAGPALLAVALWRRGLGASLLAGLVFGLAFFVPLLSWLLNVAWYAWLALAASEAVIFAVLAVGQRVLLGLRAWPLAVAGWWVCAEALRARWPYAFPWGRLAMSQAGTPAAPWAAIGGAPLLTFLVALAGATLAWALLVPGRRRAMPWLVVAAAVGLALAGSLLPVDRQAPGTPTATVAAVQGNVPHARNLPDLLRASTVTANHVAATERLAAQVRSGARPAPDVVIWPENAADLDPRFNPEVYARISAAVNAINRPVLVGTLLADPVRNASQLWLPGRGPVQTYVKRQLVPFGEYIPFRGLLTKFITRLDQIPRDFARGTFDSVLDLGPVKVGDVICFEVAYDGLVRDAIEGGGQMLVVQTNNATYTGTGQLEQQFAISRYRAIETGRTVVVAATDGISGIIAPDGSVVAQTEEKTRAVLDENVELGEGITWGLRAGPWVEAGLCALALVAVGLVLLRRPNRTTRLGRRSAPAKIDA
jgi:apolipoprotein N-acyltransferase